MKTLLLAATGIILGHLIAPHLQSAITEAVAETASPAILATRSFELADSKGRRRILIGSTDSGSPGIWFFDKEGKVRLNLGLYDDDSPFIVLNDDNQLAVQIFRTLGNGKAPVLVMKSAGQDRLVMGLNADQKADPFFVYYDANGTKNTVFGKY